MTRDYIDKNLVLIKKGCDKLLILEGKYNSAKVFTKNIDENAKNQIVELLNQRFVEDAKIRIMPDVHAGKGSVIGLTANLGDKIIPNIVGGRYWMWDFMCKTCKFGNNKRFVKRT